MSYVYSAMVHSQHEEQIGPWSHPLHDRYTGVITGCLLSDWSLPICISDVCLIVETSTLKCMGTWGSQD